MLHLQLFRCDPFNTAMVAERVLLKDQVTPFDIQRISLGTSCSRCAVSNRVWCAVVTTVTAVKIMQMNRQSGSFPNRKRSSPITPQGMALVASYRSFNFAEGFCHSADHAFVLSAIRRTELRARGFSATSSSPGIILPSALNSRPPSF